MVDSSNLAEVNRLNDERLSIQNAIDILDEGGRVINLIVAKPVLSEETGEPLPGWPFTSGLIDVSTMEYPPQMKDAIVQFLENRIMEIANELMNLGLTGIEEPRPRSPEPTPAKSKKRRAA